MSSTSTTDAPRVCWQCLAAYNGGRLHFKWFDASTDPDELWAQIKEVIDSSPEPFAEEWMLADYEGFGPWRPGEWPTIKSLALVTEGIEEHGLAFAAWVANDESVLKDTDYHDLEESFREAYAGEWDSEEDYARNFVGECGLPGVGYLYPEHDPWAPRTEQPKWDDVLDDLDSLLDWSTIARTLMEGGWSHRENGTLYIFRDV